MERSLPARGVWIEILYRSIASEKPSRSPQGECGLKFLFPPIPSYSLGRSPQGECGLKYSDLALIGAVFRVAPRKGSVD